MFNSSSLARLIKFVPSTGVPGAPISSASTVLRGTVVQGKDRFISVRLCSRAVLSHPSCTSYGSGLVLLILVAVLARF